MNQVTIRVPATTANLGPGFDAFGCALGLYTDVTFEETEYGLEIEFQTDSFEILSKQLIEYGSGIEIVQPDELKCITRKHLAQITNHCLNLI